MEEKIVLYIGGFELPDKNAAAHRVLSNAKILKKLGKKVILIGIDKLLPANSNIFDTKKNIKGFDTYAVPYPRNKKQWVDYLTDISNYVQICEKYSNVYGIIFYNFQSVAMKKLMSYCWKNNIKCCADVTEWRSSKGENIIYRVLKESDTWYRMRILHKKMDSMIVISKYLEKYYRNYTNVVKIPVLVDCTEEKWKNDYKKSTNFLRLVYAGNPGRKDRLDKLIDALQVVTRPYHLDIIGITLEQYLAYYPEYRGKIEKNNNIVFCGRLTHIQTLEYIKQANYSVFLREDDRVSKAGFPTKFVEAITSGTPVLTNRTSNLSDYVSEDHNAILLSKFSSEEMTEALEKIPFVMRVDRELFDYQNYEEEMKKLFV